MRRRFFTLIELAISLIFLSLLLSTLFFWIHHLTLEKTERTKRAWDMTEERYCDMQLEKILPAANLKPCFFTTESDQIGRSLVFTFDNGAQVEPALSGTVLGRLYFDSHTRKLCLGIWPKPETKEMAPHALRVLLDDVKSIKFFFYAPPDPFKLDVDPQSVGHSVPKEGWQGEWALDYKMLPAMMRLEIVRGGKVIELVYDLPRSTSSRIVYREGP